MNTMQLKRSFLLIGQSNMAGRGDRGEVDPIKNSACFMLRCGLWRPMTEPINPDQSIWEGFGKYALHSGVSLAASFADAYQKEFGCEVGLIPCAYGGSRLIQWMPGENLFEHAVLQTQLALRDSTLAGILWHQGEGDSGTMKEAGSYFERFSTMIESLRSRLGSENVPLVVGELGSFVGTFENGEYPYWQEINRALHRAEVELPKCAVVPADGLSSRPDGLHFNSQSLREFGIRYFEALKTIK
ncbi:MAG: sialate O-acetylesterase [Oscillospiraceae bacterium]